MHSAPLVLVSDRKFLDSFRRATDSFKTIWMQKTWTSPSLEQLCWCTYHFVRLYVSSFAFQAHVQRAQARAEAEAIASGDIKPEGKERSVQLFPRGKFKSLLLAHHQALQLRLMPCSSTNRSMQRMRYSTFAYDLDRWVYCDICPLVI